MENERPPIPDSEMNSPVGADMPERKPLPLLPEREWLAAKIDEVKYQFAMFKGQIQYLTDKEDNPILDEDGNQIKRREFEVIFSLRDHALPNGDPRKQWLRMGASMGDKAHLPVFLYNVLGAGVTVNTPAEIVSALTGCEVQLQIANKPNLKDTTKPPYQNVVYDAVRGTSLPPQAPPTQPIDPAQVDPTAEEDPFADTNDVPF